MRRGPLTYLCVAALGLPLLGLLGCDIPRDQPAGGQHPEGWITTQSPEFHGRWLRSHGDKLGPCRTCHGADYAGGPVGVGCNNAGCHTRGPEDCGTCHGGAAGPKPSTGAHDVHVNLCTECHGVPKRVDDPGHIDGAAQVTFSGLALTAPAMPSWDPATKTCAGTYCHVSAAPIWQPPSSKTKCDACHEDPPASHARFAPVAAPGSCSACHPAPPDPRHINGTVDLSPQLACDTCHGKGPLGAPAPALDGSTDPKARGVGAHRRHLDDTLDDRMGRVVPCSSCHPVPASVLSPGHLDTTSPADVVLPGGGIYDAAKGSCTTDCHFNRAPGPVWTDTSGAARACDACHGFPPVLTRKGTPHTPAAPDLPTCLGCHPFSPTTHVNGTVELGP